LQQRFVDGIAAITGATTAQQHFACEALVATLVHLVTARFITDDVATLASLAEPIATLAGQLLTPPDHKT
ncbi:hypothetical protein, partial [Solihabitans fulvus]|uniref:hypothetical protein n=1 Tax=Solihabitans fulvus TaxID=1892852 RepID=UPI001CB767AE